MYIDTATYNVVKLDALKGGSYVTYDLNSLGVTIAFNMFAQDETYVALAKFVYSKYV